MNDSGHGREPPAGVFVQAAIKGNGSSGTCGFVLVPSLVHIQSPKGRYDPANRQEESDAARTEEGDRDDVGLSHGVLSVDKAAQENERNEQAPYEVQTTATQSAVPQTRMIQRRQAIVLATLFSRTCESWSHIGNPALTDISF